MSGSQKPKRRKPAKELPRLSPKERTDEVIALCKLNPGKLWQYIHQAIKDTERDMEKEFERPEYEHFTLTTH